MKHRLGTEAGRELSAQRKQTIEPVFGIIEATPGFRRLSVRCVKKVRTEGTLMTLAPNLMRLFRTNAALSARWRARLGSRRRPSRQALGSFRRAPDKNFTKRLPSTADSCRPR